MHQPNNHSEGIPQEGKVIHLASYRQDGEKAGLYEPGSVWTHLAGCICILAGCIPFLKLFGEEGAGLRLLTSAIFLLASFLLYAASSAYHSVPQTHPLYLTLRKLDHAMIYFLIAGTYTPVCVLGMPWQQGRILLGAVWGLALLGLFQCFLWIDAPKWVNASIYIAMGWSCLFSFPTLIQTLTTAEFRWLLAGGIIYTLGGVIYALKLPLFNQRHPGFGSHEIFHLFVLAGNLCHYLTVYSLSA